MANFHRFNQRIKALSRKRKLCLKEMKHFVRSTPRYKKLKDERTVLLAQIEALQIEKLGYIREDLLC